MALSLVRVAAWGQVRREQEARLKTPFLGAYVGSNCKIGKNVWILCGAHVGSDVVIEDGVTVGVGAQVKSGSRIAGTVGDSDR